MTGDAHLLDRVLRDVPVPVEWSVARLAEVMVQPPSVLSVLPVRACDSNVLRLADGDGFPYAHLSPVREFPVVLLDDECRLDGDVRDNKRQMELWAERLSRWIDRMFFGGVPKGTRQQEFAGLNHLIGEGLGQEVDAGKDGGPLTIAKMEEASDAMRDQRPHVWFMNRATRRNLTGLLREAGQDIPPDRMADEYENAPVLEVRNDYQGNEVLSFGEPHGDNPSTTSIYGVHLDMYDGVFGILGNDSCVRLTMTPEAREHTIPSAVRQSYRAGIFFGVGIASPYSVVRLKGIV